MIGFHKSNIACGYLFGKFSVCILVVMLLRNRLDTQRKGRRLSSWKEKRYKEKVVFNIKKNLAYFSLVLPLYRNRPIDLLCKSVDWFLYNGNTGLNGKVDYWLMKTVKINMLIFRYMFFVFRSNSIFHFNLSRLVQNYDFSFKSC